MKISSTVSLTIAFALLAIPFSSQAQSWSCKNGDSVREISIQTDTPGSPVPCSVVYKKVTEGGPELKLWTATNDAVYCADKAKAFIEKQTSWGWTCEEAMAGAATAVTPAN